jgi:hypothetical protein
MDHISKGTLINTSWNAIIILRINTCSNHTTVAKYLISYSFQFLK